MQLVHVELSQHARGLAAWEVWTVRDHAPFTSARDAHDAPGAAAAPQSRAGAWTSRGPRDVLNIQTFIYTMVYTSRNCHEVPTGG